jgi:hypothetical protein
MRKAFVEFDGFLIERIFQPLCNFLADRFGIARFIAAGLCLDLSSLGWIVSRAPGLERDVQAWDATPAAADLILLLLGLAALTGLRTVFRRQAGQQKANPLREVMRPHRGILLLLFAARMSQIEPAGISQAADGVMLVAALLGLYLGACAERPPLRRGVFALQAI